MFSWPLECGMAEWRLRCPPALAAAILLGLGGLTLLGQGVYIHAKAVLAQVLLESAFADAVRSGEDVKPWSWADTWPVAKVGVPRLGAEAIVLEGSSGQALAFGPGRVAGSAKAGLPGTAVYAAHRDTHFSFLGGMKPGDEIEVTRSDGVVASFTVTGASVVRWDRSGIDPHARGRNLALVTCWPLDARTPGPMRYVVHAVANAADTHATVDSDVSGDVLRDR